MVQALSRIVEQEESREADDSGLVQTVLPIPENTVQLTIYGERLAFLPELKSKRIPELEIEGNMYKVPIWTDYRASPTLTSRPLIGAAPGWALVEAKDKQEAVFKVMKFPT